MLVFKIVPEALWQAAVANGVFSGASIDLKDGYIHLSSGPQVKETARLHFSEQTDLLLVALQVENLGDKLRWETSRGGALFPHLYGAFDPAIAAWVKPLRWNGTAHDFPVGFDA